MVFDEYLQSITQDEIVPRIVDGILTGNVLALRILGRAKRWNGELMKLPVKIAKSTTGGSFQGDDVFSTEKQNTRQLLQFSPKGFYQSVVLIGMEMDVNATPARVLDLMKVEMESAGLDMLDSLATIFYGDGTGNGSKNFDGLDNLIDDGSVAATYGGLTRATYPTLLNSDVTSSVGPLALADLAAAYDGAVSGSKRPSLAVTTESIFSDYEALVQPTISTNVDGALARVTRNVVGPRGALSGEVGFDALFFRGVPIVADEQCPSGDLWMINEDYLAFYGLKSHKYTPVNLGGSSIDSPADAPSRNHGFHWSGLKEPVNQYAEVGQIVLMGNLFGVPRYHSKLEGIT